MTRLLSVILLAAPLLAQEQGPPPRHVDRFGDPLPAGAVQRFGSLRFRHPLMRDFAVRPGGKTVVTVGADSGVRWWDIETGKQTAGRQLAAGAMFMHKVSADGAAVAGTRKGLVVVADPATGRETRTFAQTDIRRVNFVAVSGDGARVAVGGDGNRVLIGDVTTGLASAVTVTADADPDRGDDLFAAFSGDGKRLAVGGMFGGRVVVLDAATGREVFACHAAATAAALSPAGDRLTVVTRTALWGCTVGWSVRSIDTATGRDAWGIHMPLVGFPALAVSADGRRLALTEMDADTRLIDAATGAVVRRLAPAVMCRFTPDGSRLVLDTSQRLTVWDAATGAAVGEEEPTTEFNRAAVSPAGDVLAVPRAGGVDVWDVRTGRRRQTLSGPASGGGSVAFADGGRTVLAGSPDGGMWRWDAATGRLTAAGRRQGNWGVLRRSYFTADGGVVSTVIWTQARDNRVQRVERHDVGGNLVRRAPWQSGPGDNVRWLPDGDSFVRWHSQRDGYTVGDAWTAEPRAVFSGQYRAASADGLWLVTMVPGPKTVKLPVRVHEAATGHVVTPDFVTVTPGKLPEVILHGRTAVLADGRRLRVVDLATGKDRGGWDVPAGLEGFDVPVRLKFFFPDGKTVFANIADGTALTWDVSAFPVEQLSPTHTAADLAKWWADLGDADAKVAYAAVWKLAETPADDLIPFLKQRLRPVTPPPPAEWARLMADLDHREFRVRSAALRRLEELGSGALDDLKSELTKPLSPEARERLSQLAAKMAGPGSLRFLRALVVLEEVKMPAARRLVEDLSHGMATARETKAAVATLGRMADAASWRK